MSRLTKKPIKLPEGASAKIDDGFLLLNGPKGEKKVRIVPGIDIELKERNIFIKSSFQNKKNKAIGGTTWSLVKGGVEGVVAGFSKTLDVEGVGYRVLMEGGGIVLHLGYANPVKLKIPDQVKVEIEKNSIKISGVSKNLVGQIAADIRALKKPEPYKGKGIRYRGEVIRRKAGKKAGATTAAA